MTHDRLISATLGRADKWLAPVADARFDAVNRFERMT
jgi:hypothetical protein